jgi:tetratricopeptide (TPR) repeat protein
MVTIVDSGFQLFREGRVREAIDVYSHELATNPTPLSRYNRALAHMSLGEYEKALDDYRAAEQLQACIRSARGDSYAKSIACVRWLMGERGEAMRIWEQLVDDIAAGAIAFTDAAGGVQSGLLLWFSAGLLGDQRRAEKAIRFLVSRSKLPASKSWPGPIGDYVLKRISYPELMTVAQEQPALALRRGCQGAFYAAIGALLDDDENLATHLLKKAIDYGEEAALDIEYYLGLQVMTGMAASI